MLRRTAESKTLSGSLHYSTPRFQNKIWMTKKLEMSRKIRSKGGDRPRGPTTDRLPECAIVVTHGRLSLSSDHAASVFWTYSVSGYIGVFDRIGDYIQYARFWAGTRRPPTLDKYRKKKPHICKHVLYLCIGISSDDRFQHPFVLNTYSPVQHYYKVLYWLIIAPTADARFAASSWRKNRPS